MRHWWIDAITTGTKEERKREKSILESRKLKVSALFHDRNRRLKPC